MAGKRSGDMTDADFEMSLEEFVMKFTLPHFAKVKEGIYEPYTANSLEFSSGELLELYRVVYPLMVTLDFVHPTSGKKQRVSMSTMNDDLKFHVLSRTEKPFVYSTVKKVIDAWPLIVKPMRDDTSESVSVFEDHALGRPAFRKNDELRLIRKLWDEDKKLLLECKVQRTKELIRLPATAVGPFLEATDSKSYTLQELIDIAVVERRLKLDQSYQCKPISLKGIPRNYSGTLHLSKPQVQVQISRIQQDEYSSDYTVSDPFLVSIDCEIVISPRDETYQLKPSIYKTFTPSSLVGSSSFKCASVARIVSWMEQSVALQNHLIRPGDYLVFYERRSVDMILGHCGNRYFLVPVSNKGKFVRSGGNSQLKLDRLEKHQFPFSVQFFSEADDTFQGETLSLDAFIKDEPCVLVSKIFGDRFGPGFHLPLRTKIMLLPAQWRGERPPKTPTKYSTYDDSLEEISETLYNEVMEQTSNPNTGQLPPAIPPRLYRPNPTLADRPKPTLSPTVPYTQANKANRKNNDKDEGKRDNREYLMAEEASAHLCLPPSPRLPSTQEQTATASIRPPLHRKESRASEANREDRQPPGLSLNRKPVPREVETSSVETSENVFESPATFKKTQTKICGTKSPNPIAWESKAESRNISNDDYSYVDARCMGLQRPGSTSEEEIDKASEANREDWQPPGLSLNRKPVPREVETSSVETSENVSESPATFKKTQTKTCGTKSPNPIAWESKAESRNISNDGAGSEGRYIDLAGEADYWEGLRSYV